MTDGTCPPSYNDAVVRPNAHTARGYGPTPITADTGALLRSYDTQHAMTEADKRARRRFLKSFGCAVVVWILVAVVLSQVAEEYARWQR